MAAPTALEQLVLEYINDARIDPLGNAARYMSGYGAIATSGDAAINNALRFFGVSGPALQQAYAALVPTNPVAWSDQLSNAALLHNAAMISSDTQTHQAPGEPDLGVRLTSAGYNFSTAGENVFAFASSALFGHAGFMVDWGQGPDGMQSPAGHRISIMNPAFREVGIAVTLETNSATQVGPQVVTHDFATRQGSTAPMIVGVAYADTDGDDFYSVGEGRAGLSVSAGNASTLGFDTGGYTLQTSAGTQTVTYSGAGLAGPVSVTLNLSAGTNVKIDFVGGVELKTSASATVSGAITNLEIIGAVGRSLTASGSNARNMSGASGNDSLQGGSGANYIRGNGGNDSITGGTGFDDINGNMGNDTARGGDFDDWVVGGKDNDSLSGEAGGDLVYGNLGDDTCDGGDGNDVLRGGQDNDVVRGGAGADYVSGDRGDDTVSGGLGADLFHSFGDAGIDRVLDFSAAEGDRVLLDPGTTFTTAQAGADTVASLTGGAQVVLVGVQLSTLPAGWIFVS